MFFFIKRMKKKRNNSVERRDRSFVAQLQCAVCERAEPRLQPSECTLIRDRPEAHGRSPAPPQPEGVPFVRLWSDRRQQVHPPDILPHCSERERCQPRSSQPPHPPPPVSLFNWDKRYKRWIERMLRQSALPRCRRFHLETKEPKKVIDQLRSGRTMPAND